MSKNALRLKDKKELLFRRYKRCKFYDRKKYRREKIALPNLQEN